MGNDSISVIPRMRRVVYTTFALLPASNLRVGDLAYCTDTLSLYRWNSAAWQVIAQPYGAGEGMILYTAFLINTVVQGTWAYVSTFNYMLEHRWDNDASHADGDEVTAPIFLAAGTYEVTLVACSDTDNGIVDIELDGTAIASFDTYAAVGVAMVRYTDASNVIPTQGIYTLGCKINGKNPASTDHKCSLQAVIFRRTA